MVPGSLDADEEAVRDLLVGQPLRHETQHFALALTGLAQILWPGTPFTPKLLRKADAASASTVAPRRSKLAAAARPSATADPGSEEAMTFARARRARASGQGEGRFGECLRCPLEKFGCLMVELGGGELSLAKRTSPW